MVGPGHQIQLDITEDIYRRRLYRRRRSYQLAWQPDRFRSRQACRTAHHRPRPDEDRFYLDEALPRPELDRPVRSQPVCDQRHDMALLDLKAKVLGVPCYELLGGAYRKDILLYANYWFTGGGHNEADYAAQARRVMDAGFTGLKFDPFAHTNYFYGEDLASNLTLTAEQQDLAFNVSKAVREAVGPECDIMIETHAMLNYRIAVKMAERLAKLDITWYEEPAGPESSQTLRAMRERIPSDVAICVGERHYTRFGIRSLLEKHVCDVIMPDITRCGGPSEMKRMATMAEAYNVLIAPHNPNGPLSTLASSHVCAAIPNFFRQEFMFNDVPWRDTVIDHPIAEMVYDGHLHLSDRPGLGVDLVEEEMEKHPGITTDAPDNFYI